MKKNRDRKLHLHRETLNRLASPEVDPQDLARAAGGVITSCIEPNCCGIERFAAAE